MKNIYFDDFLNSEEVRPFKEWTGRDSISFSKFKEGVFMGPCIRAPKSRVCVYESVTEDDCCPACAAEAAKKEENSEGVCVLFL